MTYAWILELPFVKGLINKPIQQFLERAKNSPRTTKAGGILGAIGGGVEYLANHGCHAGSLDFVELALAIGTAATITTAGALMTDGDKAVVPDDKGGFKTVVIPTGADFSRPGGNN